MRIPTQNNRVGLLLWPALLMLATLGVTGAAVWEAARSARSEREIADETLQDYASFASSALEQRAQRAVEQVFWAFLSPEHMGGQVHQRPPVPTAASLAHQLPWDSAGCYCHRPPWPASAFLAMTLGRDSLEVVPNLYAGAGTGVLVDTDVARFAPLFDPDVARRRAVAPDEVAKLVAALTRDARTTYRLGWGLGVLMRPANDGSALVGYTLMPTAWGDTLLYAVALDADATRALMDSVAREPLLPDALTARASGGVQVAASVSGPAGHVLFATDPPPAGRWVSEARLPPTAGGLVVRAALPESAAGDLLIGGLPASRLPLLAGLLALALILAVAAALQLRRAAQLARARSDFVSSVSHELRTPLAQVRLYLETLRLGRFRTTAQRERALETIDRETSRLATLVDNVLYFDRAARGAQRPAPVPTDLKAEVSAVAQAFEPLARARRMDVVVDADAGARARVVPQELQQVLANLLDNAAKYGPEGQSIEVHVTRRDGVVEIAVSDAGPGVPAAERPSVWQPFRRGASSATNVPGSGIGLAVVREIVERHGGRVRVEDAPGGGARFVVSLPALEGGS